MIPDGLPPLMPGGESTSAQLRRVRQELADALAERDQAIESCEHWMREWNLVTAELEQLRAAHCPERTEGETVESTTDGGEDGSRAATLLDLPLPENDADAPTVRDYLIALLREAWEQGEDFCKRPFGNSGWQYEIYTPMVKAGLIPGTIDSDGELDDCDTRAADALMDEAIQALALDRGAP